MLRSAKRLVRAGINSAGYDLRKLPAEACDTSRSSTTLEAALATICSHANDEKKAAQIFDKILEGSVAPNHRSLSWGDRLLTLDKSATFRNDATFQQAFEETTGEVGATQYASPHGISWRLNTLIWAARNALKLPGDLVELGVYKGDMSWVIARVVDLAAHDKTFYLYDTFEGFAPQHSSKSDFPTAEGFFAKADLKYKEPDIHASVCKRFSRMPHVKIIKGIVPEILNEVAPAKIAFLHLDLNSAGPEIAALKLLFDRISPGGIVIFDDYGWVLHRNQQEAEDLYMATLGYEILELPTGQGILFKR